MTEILAHPAIETETGITDPAALFADHVNSVREHGDALSALTNLSFRHAVYRGIGAGVLFSAIGNGLGPIESGIVSYSACATVAAYTALRTRLHDKEEGIARLRLDTQYKIGESYELFASGKVKTLIGGGREVDMLYGGCLPDLNGKERNLPPNALDRFSRLVQLAELNGVRNIALEDDVYANLFTNDDIDREPDATAATWLREAPARLVAKSGDSVELHIMTPKEWAEQIQDEKLGSMSSLLDKLIDLSPNPRDPLIEMIARYREYPDANKDTFYRTLKFRLLGDLGGQMRIRLPEDSPEPYRTAITQTYITYSPGRLNTYGSHGSFDSSELAAVFDLDDSRIAELVSQICPENKTKTKHAVMIALMRRFEKPVEAISYTVQANSGQSDSDIAASTGLQEETLFSKRPDIRANRKLSWKGHRLIRAGLAALAIAGTTLISSIGFAHAEDSFQARADSISRNISPNFGLAGQQLPDTDPQVLNRLLAEDPLFRNWDTYINIKNAVTGAVGLYSDFPVMPDNGQNNQSPYNSPIANDNYVGNITSYGESADQLQWYGTAFDMDGDGYWATNSSRLLYGDSGTKNADAYLDWYADNNYEFGLVLPHMLNSQMMKLPHIHMYDTSFLSQSDIQQIQYGKVKRNFINVPVLDGMIPAAGTFEETYGKKKTEVPLQLMSQEDNTFALMLPAGVNPADGQISYWLTPDPNSNVHATGKISFQGNFDFNEGAFLSDWNRYLPGIQYAYPNNGIARAYIVATVIKNWPYALNPISASEMLGVKNLSAYGQAVINGRSANCNLEETMVALQDLDLNTIYGYNNSGMKLKSQEVELWSHFGHAWAVAPGIGDIIDGVPSRVSKADASYFNTGSLTPIKERAASGVLELAEIALISAAFLILGRRRIMWAARKTRDGVYAAEDHYREAKYERLTAPLLAQTPFTLMAAIELAEQVNYRSPNGVDIETALTRSGNKDEAITSGEIVRDIIRRRSDLTSSGSINSIASLAIKSDSGLAGLLLSHTVSVMSQGQRAAKYLPKQRR